MDPLLWGPCTWRTLFSIAFNSKSTDLRNISKLLKVLEKVLPCPTCRAHYIINRQGADKLFPLSKSTVNVQYWLWHLKSLVNKGEKQKNIEFKYVKLKYDVFGHTICDTELADMLMLISIAMKRPEEQKKFHEFLFLLGTLISNYLQGPLPSLLLCVESSQSRDILQIVNTLRCNYGLKLRTEKHYEVAMTTA